MNSQLRKRSRSTLSPKPCRIPGMPNDCPLESRLELIILGSMEKTAMISWWWEQRPGKEPCVPHACLTCSHLSGTCFSTSQWEHFVPIQMLCIFTWKYLLLKLCQCWGVLVPRREKKLRMAVCFQERVFSLSPQILLPFTCSAWTGGCV